MEEKYLLIVRLVCKRRLSNSFVVSLVSRGEWSNCACFKKCRKIKKTEHWCSIFAISLYWLLSHAGSMCLCTGYTKIIDPPHMTIKKYLFYLNNEWNESASGMYIWDYLSTIWCPVLSLSSLALWRKSQRKLKNACNIIIASIDKKNIFSSFKAFQALNFDILSWD
jgi:hypothetical protein